MSKKDEIPIKAFLVPADGVGIKYGDGKKKMGRPSKVERMINYATIKDQLIAASFDPVAFLIDVARDETQDIAIRKSCVKDLLDKSYPDLKAVAIKSESENEHEMIEIKTQLKQLIVENKKEY